MQQDLLLQCRSVFRYLPKLQKKVGLQMLPRIALVRTAACVMSLFSMPSSAGSAVALRTVLNNCQNRQLDPDTRIDACSQLIHANLVSHGILTAFYAIRGEAYLQKGDYPHALEDYNKAIELAPFAQAFANRAVVFEHTGRLDDADQDRERAGFYHLLKGECDKALPNYDKALSHNSRIAAALFGRGLCKIRTGDSAGGSKDLVAARAIDADIDRKYDWPK